MVGLLAEAEKTAFLKDAHVVQSMCTEPYLSGRNRVCGRGLLPTTMSNYKLEDFR